MYVCMYVYVYVCMCSCVCSRSVVGSQVTIDNASVSSMETNKVLDLVEASAVAVVADVGMYVHVRLPLLLRLRVLLGIGPVKCTMFAAYR